MKTFLAWILTPVAGAGIILAYLYFGHMTWLFILVPLVVAIAFYALFRLLGRKKVEVKEDDTTASSAAKPSSQKATTKLETKKSRGQNTFQVLLGLLLVAALVLGIGWTVNWWAKRMPATPPPSPTAPTVLASYSPSETLEEYTVWKESPVLIDTENGRARVTWGPVGRGSYRVRYPTASGTAIMSYPADAYRHVNLPFPLPWVELMTMDTDSVRMWVRKIR